MEAKIRGAFRALSRFSLCSLGLYGTFRGWLEYWAHLNRSSSLSLETGPVELSSGDFLLMTHNCSRSLTYSSMKRCYIHKAYKGYTRLTMQTDRYRQSEWDNTGLVVTTPQGPRVLFNHYGAFYDLPASEALVLPLFSSVSLRRLDCKDPSLQQNSAAFREEFNDLYSTLAASFPVSLPPFRDSIDILINYWVRTGLADMELTKTKRKLTEADLASAQPPLLARGIGHYSNRTTLR